jgi:hypothetical protein
MFRINRDPDPAAGGGAATVVVDNKVQTPPAYTPPTLDMKTALPPEYRDKPTFKDIDSFDKLVKGYANAQELIGKRPAGIPGPDAKPEEWENFHAQLRPKDANEYEFAETEYSKKHGADKEFQTAMRAIAHKAGLSKQQLKTLNEGYDAYLDGLVNSSDEKLKLSETEHNAKLDKVFGADRQKFMDITDKLISENVPSDLHEAVKNLPGEAKLIMAAVLKGVHEKYIKEDNFNPQGISSGGEDEASLRKQATELMASKAYNDFREPTHEAVKQQIADLYKKIGALHNIKK